MKRIRGVRILLLAAALAGILMPAAGAAAPVAVTVHGLSLIHILPFPCRLEHDSKAAAFLELWQRRDLQNAVVLLLNCNLGGAVVVNRRVLQGTGLHGGLLEHLCIDPDGPRCYCGRRGCLETYCSAESLEKAAGMPAEPFFRALRAGDAGCCLLYTSRCV